MAGSEALHRGQSAPAGFLTRLGRGFRRWRDTRRLKAELAEISDQDLADMGFTREDLESYFDARPVPPRAMALMMRRFGIRVRDVPLNRWHSLIDAQQACRDCRRAEVCRAALRWGPDQETPEQHCPNRAFLTEIAEIARRRDTPLSG